MGKLTVVESLSLDGVMQAPGGPEEDPRDRFAHGGWALAYPYTEVLNRVQKYVASRTLTEPLPWKTSTLVKGDAVEAVAELKAHGPDLTMLGSHELLQGLMRRNLVDQYLLLIHPLVLGSGLRMFAHGATFGALRLVESVTTTTGLVIATYEPEATA